MSVTCASREPCELCQLLSFCARVTGVCCDRARGLVFVSDFYNQRVLVLDGASGSLRQVTPRKYVHQPDLGLDLPVSLLVPRTRQGHWRLKGVDSRVEHLNTLLFPTKKLSTSKFHLNNILTAVLRQS